LHMAIWVSHTHTFSLRLERAKWAEHQVRLMYGILKKGRRVCDASQIGSMLQLYELVWSAAGPHDRRLAQ
jgi:hypothetical protein